MMKMNKMMAQIEKKMFALSTFIIMMKRDMKKPLDILRQLDIGKCFAKLSLLWCLYCFS